MTKEIKHTPLPWIDVGTMIEIEDDNASDICTTNPELFGQEHLSNYDVSCANANFIATACNNHYELLKALENIAQELEDVYDVPQYVFDAINSARSE